MNLFDHPIPTFEKLVSDVEADGPLDTTVLASARTPTACDCENADQSYVSTWLGPCLDGKMHRVTCRHAGAAETAQKQRLLALQPAPPPAVTKASVGLRRLSHSELVSFLTCTRLHHFAYRLRREPKTTAEPLLVGRRVETIIKQIWLGQTPDLSELPPEERALCKAYPIWWQYHTLKVNRVDIPFQVELAGVQYVGELDGDGEDKSEEVIVELKTTSEGIEPGAPYWRRVAQVDPQVTTYLMAARAQGRKLRRVVYDVIRKTTLERAKATPLEKRKYTKVTKAEPIARLYANMRENDETDDEFELRVLEDIAEKPEKYFQRHDIVRYEDEHQAHLRDVAGNVRLMQLVEEMPEAPRNVNSCFKWGRSCAYLPVCLGEDRIDNNFLYQDRKRATKRWGLWGGDVGFGAHWLEESQGKPRTFESKEEAGRWMQDLWSEYDSGSMHPGSSVWEPRELPGKKEGQ